MRAPQPLSSDVAAADPNRTSRVRARREKRPAIFLRLAKSGHRSRLKAMVPPIASVLCSIARAAVCTVIVTYAGEPFSVTVEGLNVAVAPAGRPETLKVMGLVKGAGLGASTSWNAAALPGVVVREAVVTLGPTVKSGSTVITSLSAVEVLPVKSVVGA